MTTAITGTLASTFTTAKTLTLPDATDTLVGRATTDTLTNKTITGLTLSAGTSSVGPITFTSGTNLTTPIAGSLEYDGTNAYFTNDTTSGRHLIDTPLYATTGLFAAPLKNATTAQPLFGGFVSATGTLGTPSGTGPWTTAITGMSNAGGYRVGTTITATAGTGSLNTNTNTIVSIDSATGMTISSTGGTIPTAGTITALTSTTTGALSLPANTTYDFELKFNTVNTGSSTKIVTFTGTATYGEFYMTAYTVSAAAAAATANAASAWNNATTPTLTIISTAATTAISTLIKGTFRVTASGTFIPNITFSVGGTATLGQCSIKLTPVTTGTSFAVGAWA